MELSKYFAEHYKGKSVRYEDAVRIAEGSAELNGIATPSRLISAIREAYGKEGAEHCACPMLDAGELFARLDRLLS